MVICMLRKRTAATPKPSRVRRAVSSTPPPLSLVAGAADFDNEMDRCEKCDPGTFERRGGNMVVERRKTSTEMSI